MMNAVSIEHLKNCIGLGIDVSKASLSFAGITADQKTYLCALNNEREDIETLAKRLVKANYQGNIICESTGHYHLKLVAVFSNYPLNLIVINPLQASKHSKANIRKTKTDPVDAECLAQMCITERNLPKPTEANEGNILIRLKMGQLCFIEKLLQRIRRSNDIYSETYSGLGFLESDIQQELKSVTSKLVELKERMLKEIERLIVNTSDNEPLINDLQNIPGISSTTAALISQLSTEVKNADSWVAYLGYDTSIRESGTWKGKGKLTKRGNRYMRKRLFCAAWGAMMHDKHFKAYYEQLRGDGRAYVEALCIIAKKLLRIAYQVMVNGKKYDAKLAFPGQEI